MVGDREGVPERRGRPVDDATREAAIARIQQAMVEGHVGFDELDDRFAAVYRAETDTELGRLLADVPAASAPVPTGHHPVSERTFSLVGDVNRGGWISLGPNVHVFSLIGDATVDLSSASIPPGGATVTVVGLIGDVRAIVPDGAQVRIDTVSLIGDRRERLVPPMAGGARIHLRLWSLIGDVEVYSLSQLPKGRLRALWSRLRSGR